MCPQRLYSAEHAPSHQSLNVVRSSATAPSGSVHLIRLLGERVLFRCCLRINLEADRVLHLHSREAPRVLPGTEKSQSCTRSRICLAVTPAGDARGFLRRWFIPYHLVYCRRISSCMGLEVRKMSALYDFQGLRLNTMARCFPWLWTESLREIYQKVSLGLWQRYVYITRPSSSGGRLFRCKTQNRDRPGKSKT